ncbi:MAG: hypothetical protein EXR60_05485 [Dehalococcoidia bacterium]|nr:hypothetical protein [Dehalococcoidia bacterium]
MVGQQQPVPTESGGSLSVQEKFLPHFLHRLEELERLKHGGSAPDPVMAKILDKAIFSTWMDCVQLGAKEEAEKVLRRYAPGGEQPRELSGLPS